MSPDAQAVIRFTRRTSEPAPLAEPLIEEEALLMTDAQDAIQRLREALDGERWNLTALVYRADLDDVLDALDAAEPLLAAAEAYGTAVADPLRHGLGDATTDLWRAATRYAAQQPPAASPATDERPQPPKQIDPLRIRHG